MGIEARAQGRERWGIWRNWTVTKVSVKSSKGKGKVRAVMEDIEENQEDEDGREDCEKDAEDGENCREDEGEV